MLQTLFLSAIRLALFGIEFNRRPLMKTCPIRSRRIALQGCMLAAILSTAAFAQQEQPPRNDDSFLRSLPVEEQSRRLTRSAEAGIIFFLTPKDFLLLASDKAFHRYMDALTEPLTPDWGDALEALLQKDDYDNARFRAAVLLFRHGRASGHQHLLQLLLEEHNLHAATAFAVAQEKGSENAIIDAVVKAVSERVAFSSDLLQALVRWRSPALERELLRPEVAEAFEAANRDLLYSRLIVGTSGNVQAREQGVIAMGKLRAAVDGASNHHVMQRRAADVLRQNPDDGQMRQLLLDELEHAPDWQLFESIAETHDQRFVEPLLATINRLLQDGEDETRDMANTRVVAATHAVEAVVRLGGDVPVDLVSRLYDQLWKHSSFTSNFQRLERALLQTHNPEVLRRMIERDGPEEVERLLAIQELKPVPDSLPHYVPRSSRGWVWY